MADEVLNRRAERVAHFVEEYALAEHDPTLAGQLLSLSTDRPAALHYRILESLEARVAPFRRYHEQNPFVTAPPAALAVPGIAVVRQVANDAPMALSADELTRHILIVGSSGSGKTALLLQLCEALLHA
jgi:hypothetical protein